MVKLSYLQAFGNLEHISFCNLFDKFLGYTIYGLIRDQRKSKITPFPMDNRRYEHKRLIQAFHVSTLYNFCNHPYLLNTLLK